MLSSFIKDQNGATAIEYGLIAGMIALAIVGGMSNFSSNLNFLFSNNSSKIGAAMNP